MEILENSKKVIETDLHYRGARGYSAYEIAVQNGFIGTEEEWLTYLKDGTFNKYKTDYDEYSNTKKEEFCTLATEQKNSIIEQSNITKNEIIEKGEEIEANMEEVGDTSITRIQNLTRNTIEEISHQTEISVDEIEKLIAYITEHRAEIDPNAEILEARNGKTTLGQRLNNFNIELYDKLTTLAVLKSNNVQDEDFNPYINKTNIKILTGTINLRMSTEGMHTEELIDYPEGFYYENAYVIAAGTGVNSDLYPKTFGWTFTPDENSDIFYGHYPIQVQLFPANAIAGYNNKIKIIVKNIKNMPETIRYFIALYVEPLSLGTDDTGPIRPR